MDLGDRLRNRRIVLNLTQQDLAVKLFVTRQTISKWELGKSEPDPLLFNQLANALDLASSDEIEIIKKQEKSKRTSKNMIGIFVGVLIFGILFLPARILWVTIRKYWLNGFVRFIILPLLAFVYLFYLHSLNIKAFWVILLITFIFYYAMSFYFYSDKKDVNKDEENPF